MSCSVFWIQKLRGSAFLPVEGFLIGGPAREAALAQATHAFGLVKPDLARFLRGVTKMSVDDGVRSASMKPATVHALGTSEVPGRQVHAPLPGAQCIGDMVLAPRPRRVCDLSFAAFLQFPTGSRSRPLTTRTPWD